MSDSKHAGPASAWAAPPLFLDRDDFEWPGDTRMFYLLSASGLFICRNHEFFKSCVLAPRGPSELNEREPFLDCGFPLVPRELFERVVGFFDAVRLRHNSEASVLLYHDRTQGRVRVVVPEQTATVVRYSDGYQYPIGLHYFPPTTLPPDWVQFGDIHSHVDMAAYASGTDVDDELHSAGLHLVVGRLSREPADFHVEAVVDGERFSLDLEQVVEGYEARSLDVPEAWMERVRIEATSAWSSSWTSDSAQGGGWQGGGR